MTPDDLAHDPDTERFAAVIEILERGEQPSAVDLPADSTELRDALRMLACVDSLVAEETPPPTLADYRNLREIGRGGMGIVYLAEQVSLGRRVALKILPPASADDSRRVRRFMNEARAAAALAHPHIVPIHAIGSDATTPWYAMQYIDGMPLSLLLRVEHADRPGAAPGVETPQRITTAAAASAGISAAAHPARAPAAWDRLAAHWVAVAADAVAAAHAACILHRDLKPANLLVDGTGKLWVTDFGLAQLATGESRLTLTGDVLGTLGYCSPEQAGGTQVDARTDVYGLGATLYELLTGRPPFEAVTRADLLRRVLHEEPRPPRQIRSSIPADLETIVLTCLEKEPTRRYASARLLAGELQSFLADRPIQARRIGALGRMLRWAKREPWRAAALLTVALALPALAAFAAYTTARAPYVAEGERVARERAVELALADGYLALATRAGEARAAFDRALDLEPDRPEALTGHVLASIESGSFHEARERIAGQRARNGGDRLADLMQTVLAQREPAGAAVVGAVQEPAPRDHIERFLLGVATRLRAIAVHATDEARFRTLMQQAFDLLDAAVLTSPIARLVYHTERAMAAGDLGLEQPPRAGADALRELWPDSARAWHAIGICLKNLPAKADRTACLDALRRATELEPDYAMAQFSLGAMLLISGDAQAAIAPLERFLELRPDAAEGLGNLSRAYFRVGRAADADAAMARALRAQPRHRMNQFHLGVMKQSRGDLDGALAAYREAQAIDPAASDSHAIQLYRNLLVILQTRDPAAARRLAEQAVGVTQRRSAWMLAWLANLQWNGGEKEAAYATLQDARSAFSPREPDADELRQGLAAMHRSWHSALGQK